MTRSWSQLTSSIFHRFLRGHSVQRAHFLERNYRFWKISTEFRAECAGLVFTVCEIDGKMEVEDMISHECSAAGLARRVL